MKNTKKVNIVGKKFGKLLIESEVELRNKNGHILYLCLCDCGNKKEILGASIRQGLTKSCGCEHISAIKKHGMDGTPIYKTWVGMRNRCNNPKNRAYPEYGGRGIKVCDRWNNSFTDFFLDMGNKPDGHSIDRINVNGNYEPENCRWATSKQQQDNRRNSVCVIVDGIRYAPSDYAKLIGLTVSGANKRMRREFLRIGNIFIKESDPAYSQVLSEIKGNFEC